MRTSRMQLYGPLWRDSTQGVICLLVKSSSPKDKHEIEKGWHYPPLCQPPSCIGSEFGVRWFGVSDLDNDGGLFSIVPWGVRSSYARSAETGLYFAERGKSNRIKCSLRSFYLWTKVESFMGFWVILIDRIWQEERWVEYEWLNIMPYEFEFEFFKF